MNRKCLNCGKHLGRNVTWRRKFCDARCRVQANRRKKQPSGYAEAMTGISLLGKVDKARRKYAIEALKALKKAIDVELRNLGDVDTVDKYQMMNERARKRLGG